MKKFNNIICTLLAIISLSALLTGCVNSLEKQLVGEWLANGSESKTLQFYEDGTCSLHYSSGEATYIIDSEKGLKITGFLEEPKYYVYVSADELSTTEEEEFWCIDGDKLYIGSATYYYVKQ